MMPGSQKKIDLSTYRSASHQIGFEDQHLSKHPHQIMSKTNEQSDLRYDPSAMMDQSIQMQASRAGEAAMHAIYDVAAT